MHQVDQRRAFFLPVGMFSIESGFPTAFGLGQRRDIFDGC
jgi:hypothetical protein